MSREKDYFDERLDDNYIDYFFRYVDSDNEDEYYFERYTLEYQGTFDRFGNLVEE